MEDGSITIGLNIDTKSFDAQIAATERKLQNLEDEYELASKKDNFDKNSEGAIRLRKEIEKCTNELIRLREQQDKLDNNSYGNIKKKLDDIGKSTEKNTKKVAKWALAIFGVRSAYMFVRNAINTLSESDPQLKADIDYIKAALVSAIEPVVRRIVDFVKQLLMYIGYIIKAWTGKNIFENANKNLKGANKQAKELQKTLTGFDEMNVINDSSSGGGDTAVAPSFDLSNVDSMEVPGWVKWIAENKEIVIGALTGIAVAVGLIKLGGLIDGITRLKALLTPLLKFIAKNAKTLGGIVAIGVGLIEFIRGIIEYLKDPTWNNFLIILEGVLVISLGIFLLFGGIPALIALIIGLVVALGVAIYKNWDKIKNVIDIAIDAIKGAVEAVGKFFAGLWEGIKNGFIAVWDFILNAFNKGGEIFTGIAEGILNVFKTIVNGLISGINFVIGLPFKAINGLLNKIRNAHFLGVSPFKGLWKQDPLPVPEIPKLAKGGIINQPGRGVAIGGEAGMEGVIPLTDSQQMALLGEAIGKYITINATVINSMNGRILSKEIKKIQNENDFAFNR